MGTLGKAIYTVGFWIRETGQAIDRLGSRLQGNYYFQEQGHSAVLHGCTVEDEAFVGMGATLLDGVVVEKHGMVTAGSLVRQNTRIPAGEVWADNPAKFLRKLTEEEIAFISQSAINYANLAQVHAAENAKSFDEIEFEKVLRKKFAHQDEEYDSMIGVIREVPPELILPDNILPDKSPKPSQ